MAEGRISSAADSGARVVGRVRLTSPSAADREDETRLVDLPGLITALKPTEGGLAATVYAFSNDSKLHLLDVDEE